MFSSAFDFLRRLGTTSIEVYEWSEADVRVRRLARSSSINTLTTKKPDLNFSGISLAHAVVKADYLDRRSLLMPGLGLLLQSYGILDAWSNPIALRCGASRVLNDVSQTSLAARLGQGLTILYGQSLGLKFAAHLRSHLAAKYAAASPRGAIADFIFADGERSALFESKASFTLQANDHSHIKRVLKDALENQVDTGMKQVTPTPSNGYVIYSCLRERTWGPSAMFVVDPPSNSEGSPKINLTPDLVLRENYAAWLRAMGLLGSAARLLREPLDGEEEPEMFLFYLQEMRGRTYAFSAFSLAPYNFQPSPAVAIGLDIEVLRAVSNAVLASDDSQELRVELNNADSAMKEFEQSEGLSFFPDGSVFGFVHSRPAEMDFLLL